MRYGKNGISTVEDILLEDGKRCGLYKFQFETKLKPENLSRENVGINFTAAPHFNYKRQSSYR